MGGCGVVGDRHVESGYVHHSGMIIGGQKKKRNEGKATLTPSMLRTSTHSLCVSFSHLGEPLHNNFVDLVRFNSQGKIAQMKEFFDSEHVHRHVDAHEKKQKQEKE